MRRVVVVGNGIAGLTACDSLRAGGFDGELTVVGAESHQPYSRPALSKALLQVNADLGAHELPEPTHGAVELLGHSAAGLDVERGMVHLDGGGELPYDGLVIASGSRARRLTPPSPAEEGSGRELTLRTIEDAVELKRRVAARPSVIVIGGGPLGMEVASGCLGSGCAVTLVADVPPLSRQLGTHLSDIFAAAAISRGLQIVAGGEARIARTQDGVRVLLADGAVLDAEMVVTAIGDAPNVQWLAGSGLLVDGQLQADSRGRLRPNIVAAGDVSSFPTRRGQLRVPLWTSAIDSAKAAAGALLNGDEAPELDLTPYFWTEGFGLSLKAAGFTPVSGPPDYAEPGKADTSVLLRWDHGLNGGTAVALNYRIPVPKLRRFAQAGPGALRSAVPAGL
ncbi:NAD(P)/FAD-dependent oxidoreductase [Arthrobacter sp. 08Y14]|uniref:NAD(P)/FAD-dependent oxidoreductase n=1 Tax=Arthrobacter sp. 08Y14 TaxID=2058885 RepID=UPI000CE33776|nr:NAD(P)/FAD-dependent oxidoreductase [Arthrobacter sp. 08Y14]